MKDYSQKLMDYLYDEMTPKEKTEFEKQIHQDVKLQEELKSLQETRTQLGFLHQEDAMKPFHIWKTSKSNWLSGSYFKKKILLRPITAIAASLALLMIVGYLTNFSLSLNQDGFNIAFNDQSKIYQDDLLTKQEIKDIINAQISQNNNAVLSSLGNTQEQLDGRLSRLESNYSEGKIQSENVFTRQQFKEVMTDADQRNTELMKNYMSLVNNQQQEYLKLMLTQFNEYLQEQRSEDLNMIRQSLYEIKESQTLQRIETDEVLAGLITNVRKTNK